MGNAIGEVLLLMIIAAILGAIIAWTVLKDRMAKKALLAGDQGAAPNPKLKAELASVKKEYQACQKARTELRQKSEETIKSLEAKLRKTEAELTKAKKQVPTDPEVPVKASATKTAAKTAPKSKPKTESKAKPKTRSAREAEALKRIEQRSAEIDFGRIGTATAADKDDLKQIKGIGPFIEKKLNALGIYTFSQIAKFDANMEEKVNEAIEFFPGRIKRDDWKGQAAKLAKS